MSQNSASGKAIEMVVSLRKGEMVSMDPVKGFTACYVSLLFPQEE